MNEDEILSLFLSKLQAGMSVPEAGRALLVQGVDQASVDAIIRRFDDIEKKDPVHAQAERQLADLESRYQNWSQLKYRAQREWGALTGRKMGKVGRSVSIISSSPETASELLFSIAMGIIIVAASTYWLMIVRPAQPRPLNAPPHSMDCSLLPSGALPPGCNY